MNRKYTKRHTLRYTSFSIVLLMAVFIFYNSASSRDAYKEVNGFKTGLADHEVHGKVTDSTGAALPGVTVHVKDDNSIGTTTDLNGRYILEVPDGAILVFSMVGFDQQEIPVEGKTVINIKLLESTSTLEETVIIGFGKQKREDLVGAVTTVNPSDLRVPSSNLTTALAGKVAGMIAFQRSGEPGQDNANFFIRGVTSFGTGRKNPLILIDGVEMGVTDMARLRPDNIESFSVLKDATATAVYGSRAANGVILIKTKEGVEGKPEISLRAEGSLSMPTTDVEFAEPVTYMELYNKALLSRDPLAAPFYSNDKIDGTRDGRYPLLYPAVDWKNQLFKKQTFNHRYNLDVRGGGKVATYYVSGSFAQDNGDLKVPKVNNFNNNIDLKSYTLMANVNVNLTKTTLLKVSLKGNFDDYNGPLAGGAAIYNEVAHSNPVDVVPFYPKNTDNAYIEHIMFGGISEHSFTNPYADMVKGYKDYTRSMMLAQMEFNQDFDFLTEGLNAHIMFNTNKISRFGFTRSYKPFFYEVTSYDKRLGTYDLSVMNEDGGTEYLDYTADDNREQITNFYLQGDLHYDRTFNKKHRVSGMLVYMMQSKLDSRAKSLQLSLPHRNLGLSGRTTYSYEGRYYLEFNFGYNGSERFDKNHRFGFFPSWGIAWSISNEDFWGSLKNKINSFRLRFTYGLVGNDDIGSSDDRFFYLSEVNMNSGTRKSTFGLRVDHSRNGVNVERYENPLITWEKAQKANIGIELGLFNELDLKIDMYRQRRYNILMERANIPSVMGLTADVKANIGEAIGKGIDVSLDYSHSFPNRMWLQVQGNFTYANSVYEKYEEPTYKDAWWKSRIGEPISQPHGYIAERLFIDDAEVHNSPPQEFGSRNIAGDIKYKDINKDGKITSMDIVPIGFPSTPEIIYGAGFSFGWHNLDISTFFQGAARTSFFIDPKSVQPFVGKNQILKAFSDDHYSLVNRNVYALWPRLSTENQNNNVQKSTWWLRDGAFLRIKQVELGYTLPVNISEKLFIEKLRVYISGANLYNFTQFRLWDTEMGGNGLGYPLQRVFNFGINIKFK